MAIKIKSLHLQNFAGYRDTKIDFTDKNGNTKQWAILYGQNGLGKTNFLQAVKLLTNAHRYQNRDCSILLNRYVYSDDYSPSSQVYKQKLQKIIIQNKDNELYKDIIESNFKLNRMKITGVFQTPQGDKKVIIQNEGTTLNELPFSEKGYCTYIDADHPSQLSKFQLQKSELSQLFLQMAKVIYGFNAYFDKSVNVGDRQMYTGYIIEKFGAKIKYKQMSAGEKKIGTLVKALCNEDIYNNDIIIIDNIELHIYFARVPKLFEIMKQVFRDFQIICSTHSGSLIQHVNKNYNGEFLYDLQPYKIQEMKKLGIKF